MNLIEKKENLKRLIQDADEKLTGLLIALANEYNDADEKYSDEEMKSFYQTRDNLVADPKSGYSPEKANDLIRNKKVNDI